MRTDARINLGEIQVHRQVIADVCTSAISGIDGVDLFRNQTLEDFLEFFGVRYNSAVKVRVDMMNQVYVIVKIVVRYGINLSDISRQIQDVVLTAVEKTTDINLKDVDVRIQGIEKE